MEFEFCFFIILSWFYISSRSLRNSESFEQVKDSGSWDRRQVICWADDHSY